MLKDHDSRNSRGRRTANRRRFSKDKSRKSKLPLIALVTVVILAGIFIIPKLITHTKQSVTSSKLVFDDSASESEKQIISDAFKKSDKTLLKDVHISVNTETTVEQTDSVLSVLVPTTGLYSPLLDISSQDLGRQKLLIDSSVDNKIIDSLSSKLDTTIEKTSDDLPPDSEDIMLLPADKLSTSVRLLSLDGDYYLDKFTSGGFFRIANSEKESNELKDISFNDLSNSDSTLKINQTGVTALTRVMMQKLNVVKDPLYFSKEIGPFLKDADLTHISNEVSFKPNCEYNTAVFCSPLEFIETIKDSGIDLIELTGNHNNDTGAQRNTDTINQYHELGISTFGGGLNKDEASKPFILDKKGSKVAFLGYNYADSPNGYPIATDDRAGANSFDFDKVKTDIDSAKEQADFVIVDIQFFECYSYPDGFVEFPECNLPIKDQEETFKKIADLGANMVVGTQAHQPQIFEVYKGSPIYYGLGNLYFDQTSWPGTERGIILTHYFEKSKLIQTKLTPTVYDKALQTRPMTADEYTNFFNFLNKTRP